MILRHYIVVPDQGTTRRIPASQRLFMTVRSRTEDDEGMDIQESPE